MARTKTINAMRYLAILLTLFSFVSCKNKEEKKFTLTQAAFGKFEDMEVTEYTITNPSGASLSVINYGGAITKILVPDREGKLGDVVAGFKSMEGYLQPGNPYFGALIGRFGNRIAKAQFVLDSVTYQLPANNNGNSLHGGDKGFDKRYWNIAPLPGDSSLKLSYTSVDGEAGYPGNLTVEVIYTFGSDNALRIDYTAKTDKACPVNLTQHSYFNLSAGQDSTILNHLLYIDASSYTPVDSLLIPLGTIESVLAPLDFRMAKPIGADIAQVPGGYDHNWVLNRRGDSLQAVARLFHPGSGRLMTVLTTEPGLQFYSGNFLNGTLKDAKLDAGYVLHGALCLETQHYPDSPNQPAFPNTILKPGETYTHSTIYKFSIQ